MQAVWLALLVVAKSQPIQIPITRREILHRWGPADVIIENKQNYYVATIGVGTPPQDVQVDIDTGSSDLWISSSVFNCESSSSYRDTHTPFYTSYIDGSEAEGTWARDTVQVGETTLTDVTLGHATFANTTSYLGIGMRGKEAPFLFPTENGNATVPYDNVPYKFRDQGIIPSVAYSVWLDDPSAASGSLLFGGIDYSKFEGSELTLLPMYNFYETPIPQDFRVILSALSLDSSPLAILSYSALLDTGSTAVALPFPIIEALGAAINFTFNPEIGLLTGACINANDFKALEFNFLGANISVPLSALVYPASSFLQGSSLAGNQGQCVVGIAPSNGPEDIIIGDFVLRYMYVTFDLENYEVGIAQASYNGSPADIRSINGRLPGVRAPAYDENIVKKGIQTFNVASETVAAGHAP